MAQNIPQRELRQFEDAQRNGVRTASFEPLGDRAGDLALGEDA
jgi:hypothetical protein